MSHEAPFVSMEAKSLQKKCGQQAKQDWKLICHSNRNVGKLYNQEDLTTEKEHG